MKNIVKNLIPLILIFISLAVIIFILGKKIPRLRDLKKKGALGKPQAKAGVVKNILFGGLVVVRNFFVYIAEWIVKKAKKILHLIHFWLIKLKSGKKDNEQLRELEAKQELIKEEEINLQHVINEDLADGETYEIDNKDKNKITFFEEKPFADPAALSDQNQDLKEKEISQSSENKDKIKQFFIKEETPVEETFQDQQKRPGKFASVINLFKRKKKEARDGEDSLAQGVADVGYGNPYQEKGLDQESSGRFSDGIISSGYDNSRETANLIKEVVSVKRKKRSYNDEDEELGVDRSILEKKIIRKISQNPKDIENYRQLGELYIKMKNYQDAQEAYKFILKTSPRDIDSKRKLEKIKLLKRING